MHILDPFVGTGTFITRLLQSGLIRPEDMERKYLNEIHCNEIVLLAYYIADVNIEAVFHDITRRKTYLPYSGICLTDTFQLAEKKHNELFTEFFQDNSKRVKKQMATHVRADDGRIFLHGSHHGTGGTHDCAVQPHDESFHPQRSL